MVARGDVARQTRIALAVSRKGDQVRLGVRCGRHDDGRSWPSRPRVDGGGSNGGILQRKHTLCGKSGEGGSFRAPLVGKRR
jgi:hypothetical protein